MKLQQLKHYWLLGVAVAFAVISIMLVSFQYVGTSLSRNTQFFISLTAGVILGGVCGTVGRRAGWIVKRRLTRDCIMGVFLAAVVLVGFRYWDPWYPPKVSITIAIGIGLLYVLIGISLAGGPRKRGRAVPGEIPPEAESNPGLTDRRKRLLFTVPAIVVVVGFMAVTVWPLVEPLRSGERPPATSPHVKKVKAAMEKLRPLHSRLGEPKGFEWLVVHEEPGQTFAEYLGSRPVTPNGDRSVIYIQPLGDFTPTQRRIVDLTAQFMGIYFNRPVRIAENFPLSVIPSRMRREHPKWHIKQILTTYVLYGVLRPRLPKDAAVYLALTSSDLYPADDWNFVFGQASLRERVGVWSIYRNGDPDKSDESFQLCLLRTIKTATHETGHMFSMYHCTAYECNMCGSNSRGESDRHPLACCPECMAKICWATGADPVERFKKLAEFASKNSLKAPEEFYRKSLRALGSGTGD